MSASAYRHHTGTLTQRQRMLLAAARSALRRGEEAELDLAAYVKEARNTGLPILYLADALGVSRSRIRVLAREQS